VLGLQLAQTDRVTRAYASDARNPYAYVHSSPDVLKFRPLAAAALARSPDAVVRVISEEYWPLPWYLRGLDRVGYWTQAPADCDGALVIASAGQADTVRARLHGRYRESYLGLRPGFVCLVFEHQE
jgi:predicted membrane-bound mannosyltransferase